MAVVSRRSVTVTLNGDFFGDGVHHFCWGVVLRALEAFLPLLLQLIVQEDLAKPVVQVFGSNEDRILNGAY